FPYKRSTVGPCGGRVLQTVLWNPCMQITNETVGPNATGTMSIHKISANAFQQSSARDRAFLLNRQLNAKDHSELVIISDARRRSISSINIYLHSVEASCSTSHTKLLKRRCRHR